MSGENRHLVPCYQLIVAQQPGVHPVHRLKHLLDDKNELTFLLISSSQVNRAQQIQSLAVNSFAKQSVVPYKEVVSKPTRKPRKVNEQKNVDGLGAGRCGACQI